jgi:3-oxoacyl-ACP reductase-like protein
MRTPHPYRLISASAVALALTALTACNRAETPTDTPAPMPPASTAPSEAPPPAAVPPATPPAPAADAAPSTTMGEKVDDSVVTTKVKAALLADDTVKGMDISVKTVGGEVQLTGVVDNQAQVDRAVEVAKGIEGAQRVQNGMTVKQ